MQSKNLSTLYKITLAIISGFLFSTSFIPYPPWATLFCFLPLWTALLNTKTLKEIIFYSWITEISLFLIGENWIIDGIQNLAETSEITSYLLLGVTAVTTSFKLPLAGFIWWLSRIVLKYDRHSWFSFFSLAMSYTLVGFISLELTPFEIGHSFYYAKLPAAQLADTIGFAGLSGVLYFTQSFLLYVLFYMENKKNKILALISIANTFFILNLLGYIHQPNSVGSLSKNIGLLQPNISNKLKKSSEKKVIDRMQVLDIQNSLSENSFKNKEVDLIVWPETAFPVYFNKPSFFLDNLKESLKSIHTNTLVGGYTRDSLTKKDQNSAALFSQSSPYIQLYSKEKLIPFAEFLPFENYLSWLKPYFKHLANYAKGQNNTILSSHEMKLGMLICYESLYHSQYQKMTDKGANIFVNISNDAWFGDTSEPYQHLYVAAAKAIEYRRPIIRVGNSGFTTIVDSNGSISHRSNLFKKEAFIEKVYFDVDPEQTLFDKHQKKTPYFLLLIWWWTFVYARRKTGDMKS